jgi:Chalcone isomerase-like
MDSRQNPTRRLVTVAAAWAVLLMGGPAPAFESTLPGAVPTDPARLTVWGFEVYDAKLWARPGFAPAQYARQPFALELHYLRDLKGEAIARRSLEEMKRQGAINELQSKAWLKAMQSLFPDVQKGDRITGVHKPEQGAEFWVNDRWVGQVNDPQFAQLFFGIWLSPQSSVPDVRKALLARWP